MNLVYLYKLHKYISAFFCGELNKMLLVCWQMKEVGVARD